MSVEIFVNGCTSCGMNAALIARVKHSIPDVKVINTKYDYSYQELHMGYVIRAGMSTGTYHSIVVENEGERISLLKEWKP